MDILVGLYSGQRKTCFYMEETLLVNMDTSDVLQVGSFLLEIILHPSCDYSVPSFRKSIVRTIPV